MRAMNVAVSHMTGRTYRGASLAVGTLVVGIIAVSVLMPFTGLAERYALAREAQLAEIVRSEAAFCHKNGMAQGTDRHSACLNDLLDLRRQNEKRLADQDQGIL